MALSHGFGWPLVSAIVLASVAVSLAASEIPVRFDEGVSRGFLVLSDTKGQKIGEGDDQQVIKGGEIHNHLSIRFKDGSLYDDMTIFSERNVFRLISDHLREKGPSFKTPMETTIDAANGQVTVRYSDGHGKEKFLSKRMKLPADIANGMLFVLVKDLDRNSKKTAVSYLSFGPQPRLVKLVFTPQGEGAFVTGYVRRNALHYVMSVDIGGVAGMLAPVVGKQPPNTDVWVISGEAPTFAGSRGPLYGSGPVWQISLVSPEEAAASR